ncbi:Vi polysaccharide biosynthesis UDP-N-acetylglucosamine C-6 dehydrogenase TviB [Amylibacter sp.]|nr:Vi polysaccharide biosynthesis UDP-N-acetylglucosamine C-6 dehydrogenase TviB [Amylibacter sp.]
MLEIQNAKIAVIGLGYVGLPLAVEFSKKFSVIGFDINKSRIDELRSGMDITLEVSDYDLACAKQLQYSFSVDDLRGCNTYIVTVPTPIDRHKQPDLSPLIKASEMLATIINKGDVIVYESTVYPGATEEICIPVIEQISGLVFNKDFFAGYSPERINPGDKNHRLTNIIKVTSGSTEAAANFVDELYAAIIVSGTHRASSIRVAEASKVIENTQRDLNIALINELSVIFNKLNIDTLEVLEAAETKWNFLPFRPGLVGGHCIGVDPYYLTHKAQTVGYHPEIILAGRRLNDGMGDYVVSQLVKRMVKECIQVANSNILVMGLTFKENCPDLRNTKVVDVISELKEYGTNVDVVDPWCSADEAKNEYNLELTTKYKQNFYDAIILAVNHEEFKNMGSEAIRLLGKNTHILYDLKYVLDKKYVDMRL